VNRAIWRLFKDNGVKIPVAQRELRILEPTARFIKPPEKTGVDQDDN
jgi:small-conductance mechanosensitive channel